MVLVKDGMEQQRSVLPHCYLGDSAYSHTFIYRLELRPGIDSQPHLLCDYCQIFWSSSSLQVAQSQWYQSPHIYWRKSPKKLVKVFHHNPDEKADPYCITSCRWVRRNQGEAKDRLAYPENKKALLQTCPKSHWNLEKARRIIRESPFSLTLLPWRTSCPFHFNRWSPSHRASSCLSHCLFTSCSI